jgi:YVTN family beta-propeller protein
MSARTVAALLGALLVCGTAQAQQPYLHAPAINEYARHDPQGVTILGDGRLLHPAGRALPVGIWPHGLVLSPDGSMLFVASDGVGQFVTDWNAPEPTIASFYPGDEARRRSNAGGAAFSRDGKTLYWSSGDSGAIYYFNVADRKILAEVSLNTEVQGRKFQDSFAMDVQLSTDGNYLYCADVTNFRVAILDIAQQKVVGSVNVGRYPYALTVVGPRIYVANIGMFEYKPIPPPSDSHFDKRGISRPPFAVPSKEAREGVEFESRHIPGVGDPNVPDSFSVWGIDASDPARPGIISRTKTGLLVGATSDDGKTVGGSAPNFLAAHGGALYISDNNNDIIERLDMATNKLVWRKRIIPSPLVAKLRGVGPAGLVVSPDGSRLYVAESGINAIGVLDTRTGKVLGHIPTAWYPYRLALSHDGKQLFCICFKGFGNGPNAGAHIPKNPFVNMRGVLSIVSIPSGPELTHYTVETLANDGMVDRSADRVALASPVVPTTPGQVSEQIQYVVFITKENHTFDTIFDHVPGSDNDPSLLRWGYHQTIRAPGQPTLENVAVMTNHNKLARQFTVSDNFYMEPEASGVGHRWLVGVEPNNFCQLTYTLGWNFSTNSSAPGRRASFDSNASIAPEDYPEAGSMWDNLARHGVSFRNYGEGFEFAGVGEDEDERPTGAREVVNIPMEKVLFDNTCFDFPIFNMNIPDQYRAYWFEKDVTQRFLSGKHPMPHFLNIAICNDHGTEPHPKQGYPYVASWMADNDLALGRIVDFLSHTPYWKHMVIFVTQDDSGGEPDHVDAQRSVLLVISPWVKHHNVSHRHTTIVSMHRTLYEIFGLPPLNMFDALANDFSDCFTTQPDFTPYRFVGVEPRIFDPEKAKDPKDPDYHYAREKPSIQRDDPAEEEKVLREGK